MRSALIGWFSFPTGVAFSRLEIAVAASAMIACGGDDAAPTSPIVPPGPTGPAAGTMRITVSTSGQSVDPDGYTVIFGTRQEPVAVGGAVTFAAVSVGTQTVELSGVALNCFVSETNPRAVSIVANQTVQVTFNVSCIVPGGERLAFNTSRDGNSEIYLMNSDGSGLVNLTNHPAFDANPAWSPDGSKIAFTTERDGNLEIYVMNANGTGLVNLTRSPRSESMPSWSPDGSKIAFKRDVGGELFLEIAIMNADGSNPVNVSNNPDFVQRATWSPDGSRIAYGSDRDFDTSGYTELAFEIYVTDADGTRPFNLTNTDNAEDDFPAWSPDGSSIAFHSNRSGNWDIFLANPDGSGIVNLTQHSAGDYLPAWSKDGSRIAFESNRDGDIEVYVMKADGSSVVRLTNQPGADSFPAWRP
jgi:Tol biopolymer transport system component